MASTQERKKLSKIKILDTSNNLNEEKEIKREKDNEPQENKECDNQKEQQGKDICLEKALPEKTSNVSDIATIGEKLPATNVDGEITAEGEKDCCTNNLVIDLECDDDKKLKELRTNETADQKLLNEETEIETERVSTKSVSNDSINKHKTVDLTEIPLSDGEGEDQSTSAGVDSVLGKPGKVKKRRSVGIVGQQTTDDYRLKRRKINVEGAPKMPLTGYVRYMNDRRETLRKQHPNKTSMEHTKIIGEEWHTMSQESKGPYMQAAELDKQRYVKELHNFLQSRPDVLASELAKNKPRKSLDSNININSSAVKETPSDKSLNTLKDTTKENKSALLFNTNDTQKTITEASTEKAKSLTAQSPFQPPSTKSSLSPAATMSQSQSQTLSTDVAITPCNVENGTNTTAATSILAGTPSEIPIFTNEFLEHNKLYDTELKTLRKSKIDLEQQNAILEKYVENMRNGLNKIVNENNELQETNRLLEVYLDKLKRKLAQALNGLPLPNIPSGATIDNIEEYMKELYAMSNTNTHGPATLNKAKDIIRKLDLQIQL